MIHNVLSRNEYMQKKTYFNKDEARFCFTIKNRQPSIFYFSTYLARFFYFFFVALAGSQSIFSRLSIVCLPIPPKPIYRWTNFLF